MRGNGGRRGDPDSVSRFWRTQSKRAGAIIETEPMVIGVLSSSFFPPAQVLDDRKVGLELGGQSAAYVTPQPRSRRSHK